MAITDSEHVALTTFRRDGTPRSTPVWIVDLGDGTCGFTTAAETFKVRRIRGDDRVVLQASDVDGVPLPGSVPVTGRAALVTGAGFARVQAAIVARYGPSGTEQNDTGVVITLDDLPA